MTIGIASWGSYLPYNRLQAEVIGASLGIQGLTGCRTVASFDEDVTSMAVEALRAAVVEGPVIESLFLSSTNLPYADKTNATAVHAALRMPISTPAFDFGGSVRSAIGGILAAHDRGRLGGVSAVALADVRVGLAGGVDEIEGGDGAAAILFGPDPVAEIVATGHATREFLDRWRKPGATDGAQWEERFGEAAYLPLGQSALGQAVVLAGVGIGDIDHLVVGGPHGRSNRRLGATIGVKPGALRDLTVDIGNTGAAQVGLGLCDVLDRAQPGQLIALLSLADGADAILMRTTAQVAGVQSERAARGVPTVAQQIACHRDDLQYGTYLTWRQLLRREPPRRPEPTPPAAPPAARAEGWKFGFVGSQCLDCSAVHLPPARVCVACGSTDHMASKGMAGAEGTVRTFTVDHLAFTLSPPLLAAIIDFEGGGRMACELTDVDVSEVEVGMPVRMTFRKLHTASGIHNYFWKATPVRAVPTRSESKGHS